MKKLSSITALILAFLLTFTMVTSAEQFAANNAGYSNVAFSNGYTGFCIDANLSGAGSGDNFDVTDTSDAKNNIDGADVSQKLKILFTQCFDDIFVSDGNGGYVIDSFKADSSVQSAIWNFTDGMYIWGEGKTFVDKVNAYTGEAIPDSGYTLETENGEIVIFYFITLQPQKADQQSFFAYKLEVSQKPDHTHNYGDEWHSDDDNHWHECECEDVTDVAPHDGNKPDCVTESYCEDCGRKLSGVDSSNHTGNTQVRDAKPATEFEDGYTGDTYCSDCDTLLEQGEVIKATHTHDYADEWHSDDDNHWHECECEDVTDVAPHDGNKPDCVTESYCEDCGRKLSGVDSSNHTGNTEVRDAKPATEFEDGYTGDTYCTDCDTLLEQGKVIKVNHTHDYGDEWQSDDDNHWHECECSDKIDLEKHDGNVADCVTESYCSDCRKKLSDKDSSNHTGNTEVRDAKPATEFEDGYTGDTYCSDCDTLLEKGEVIKSNHTHDYGDEWQSDDDNHWHECECEDKKDVEEHKGNVADCVTESYCSDCRKKLSDKDSSNHTGNTEVRDAKPATEFEDGYTGDTYCTDCDTLLEEGEVIKANHTHDYGGEWHSDEDNHWHECECGNKTDVEGHIFEDGICTICEEPDADYVEDTDEKDSAEEAEKNTSVITDKTTQANANVIATGAKDHRLAFIVLVMGLGILFVADINKRKGRTLK